MICYKDRTWCRRECANEKCDRNYTDEEKRINAERVNLPVSVADFRTDDCGFEPKGKT